jgi:putative ABC transport system permease protein
MGNMKLILKSLMKRKLSALLIAVQIIVSILFLITISCAIQEIFYLDMTVPRNLNYPTNQILHIKMNNDMATQKKYFAFREEVFKNLNVKFLGYYNDHDTFMIDSLIKSPYLKQMRKEQNVGEFLGDGELSAVSMEKGVNSLKTLKVIKGRNFFDGDFDAKNSFVPVLAGYKLLKYRILDIGSEFYHRSEKKKYKVVGVLQEGSTWLMFTPSQGMYQYLDDQLIVPLNINDYIVSAPELPKLDYYSVADNLNDVPGIVVGMKTISEKVGLPIEIRTIKSELDESQEKVLQDNIKWLVFSLFFIIMTALEIASIMLSSVVARKREIGIRIAMGYSIRKIQNLIVGEILFILMLAALVAILIALWTTNSVPSFFYNKAPDGYGVSPAIMAIAIGAVLFMSIPPVAMIVSRIKKIQPHELIGGKE